MSFILLQVSSCLKGGFPSHCLQRFCSKGVLGFFIMVGSLSYNMKRLEATVVLALNKSNWIQLKLFAAGLKLLCWSGLNRKKQKNIYLKIGVVWGGEFLMTHTVYTQSVNENETRSSASSPHQHSWARSPISPTVIDSCPSSSPITLTHTHKHCTHCNTLTQLKSGLPPFLETVRGCCTTISAWARVWLCASCGVSASDSDTRWKCVCAYQEAPSAKRKTRGHIKILKSVPHLSIS